MLGFMLLLFTNVQAQTECAQCKFTVRTAELYIYQQGMIPAASDILTALCQAIWGECPEVVSDYSRFLVETVVEKIVDADWTCNKFQQCDSPDYRPCNFNQWKNDVLNGKKSNKAKTPGEDLIKIAQIGNIHLDSGYIAGTDPECFEEICCRGDVIENGAGEFGAYKCDLPKETLVEAVKTIASHKPQLLIWTGNSAPHMNTSQTSTQVANAVKDVTAILASELPDTIILPVIGPYDVYPMAQFKSELSSSMVNRWRDWIGRDAMNMMRENGYYSLILEQPKVMIIALNSLAYYYMNLGSLKSINDHTGQLQFLLDELLKAEEQGIGAYIIGSMSPSADGCLSEWSKRYNVIIERFENVILGQFFGDSAYDMVKINYQGAKAVGVQFIAPPMSPYRRTNPSFRIFEADQENGSLKTYKQYYLDLAAGKTEFSMAYDFAEYYLIKHPSPSLVGKEFNRLARDPNLSLKYLANRYTRNYRTPNVCNDNCRDEVYCETQYSTRRDVLDCLGMTDNIPEMIMEDILGTWECSYVVESQLNQLYQ